MPLKFDPRHSPPQAVIDLLTALEAGRPDSETVPMFNALDPADQVGVRALLEAYAALPPGSNFSGVVVFDDDLGTAEFSAIPPPSGMH